MGDVETFVSCFDPENGRMVTVIDAQGKPVLDRHVQPTGGEKNEVGFILSLYSSGVADTDGFETHSSKAAPP